MQKNKPKVLDNKKYIFLELLCILGRILSVTPIFHGAEGHKIC